jgi:hypothetical protein
LMVHKLQAATEISTTVTMIPGTERGCVVFDSRGGKMGRGWGEQVRTNGRLGIKGRGGDREHESGLAARGEKVAFARRTGVVV